MNTSDQNANDVIQEQQIAAQARSAWDQTCEQIARRILPLYADGFTGQNLSQSTTNFQNTHEMVDSTAALALKRFASAMESMNTPHTATWHTVLPQDKVLLGNREVRIWFEDLTNLLFTKRYAPTANFASQKYCDYMMVGAFGNAVLFTDALDWRQDRGFRYRSVHPGQCYFMENHQGLIDKNFRRFPLTARQALQQFGEDNLPKIIAEQAGDPKRSHLPHFFVHKVAPRSDTDYDPERKDVKGMAYESCYVSVTGKKTVRESGYHTFPYAISRYLTLPGEVMGSSIAMMALPTIKSLNEMKKTMLKQGHRIVDPVLLTSDDGVVDSVSLRAGAVVPGGVNPEGKRMVMALETGNLAVGDKMMADEKATINDHFLVSLFQILVDAPQMTATQVIERTREKGQLLTPEIRQQAESLGPQIDREIDLLVKLRLLPPMPQILLDARGQYTVKYDSPMTRMARGSERSAGTMRVVDYFKEIVGVTMNPEPMDYFNWDMIIPEMADDQSVPKSWMNDQKKVDAIRKQRAQQQQQQQLLDAAPALSGAAKLVMPPPQKAGTA